MGISKKQMSFKKKITAISGSTRKDSSNEKILTIIRELYQEELDITIFNQIDQLPHFNPDLDRGDVPESIQNFRDIISKSDGIIICTPEYVFSLPGSLKNALEWTVSTTVFSDKPLAFIVASASGEKAFESLDLIMATLIQSEVADSSKLLIQGGRSKVNADGSISDKKVLEEIKGVVDSLIRTINR